MATNNNRIAQLLQFIKDEPGDPFTIYCLATEYKASEPEKALAYYQALIADHPDYLPTYYHLAELYIHKNDLQAAEKTLTAGIRLARKQNDPLALRELRNLQNNLYDY